MRQNNLLFSSQLFNLQVNKKITLISHFSFFVFLVLLSKYFVFIFLIFYIFIFLKKKYNVNIDLIKLINNFLNKRVKNQMRRK
jgi:hypothetical protein